jgi:hypothetical protein
MSQKCYYCDKEGIQQKIHAVWNEEKKRFDDMFLCKEHKIEKDLEYIKDELLDYSFSNIRIENKIYALNRETMNALVVEYEKQTNKYYARIYYNQFIVKITYNFETVKPEHIGFYKYE